MCLCVCVRVPPMEAALVSFTTSSSCSNTQSAAYCDLLPSMSLSAPPTFPHLCSCPFSTLTLSSPHIWSYLSLYIPILCSISRLTLLFPNCSLSSLSNVLGIVVHYQHHNIAFLFTLMPDPCVIPTNLGTGRSWNISMWKQTSKFPLIIAS